MATGTVSDVRRSSTLYADANPYVVFPAHALLVLEERLNEQQAEGVRMPEGMPLDELALRVLMTAQTGKVPHRRD